MNDHKKNNNNYNTKRIHEILIVDDDNDEINALYSTIKQADQINSKITTANNTKLAMDLIEKQDFDLILTDYKMPGMDGIELLNYVKEKHPNTIRMLITGYPDVNLTKKAINNAEVHHFIEKPWNMEELLTVINGALHRKNEKKDKMTSEVNNVTDALRLITKVQNNFSKVQTKIGSKQLMLEFTTQAEFNKFFFRIKHMRNVDIDDIHIFETKYIIKLNVYRQSYDKIK